MSEPQVLSQTSSFGRLLRAQRTRRRLSQLDLALDANVSARHISFLETGRARPSREMVLQLARTLDVPLRDRNVLLTAAGFAERYRRTDLSEPEMAQIRRALDYMLRQQEPWPAIVFNSRWDMIQANQGALALFAAVLGPDGIARMSGMNMIEAMLTTDLFESVIDNWDEVRAHSLWRIRRERDAGLAHPDVVALLESLGPEAADHGELADLDADAPAPPITPVRFRYGAGALSFFTTVATFGTPQDITLQEIRIESFFPADRATEDAMRDLGQNGGSAG